MGNRSRTGPFVGRDLELDALRAGLDDALDGRGGLFLLGGEPGIGKSRLAEELAAEARARGGRVLWGRCWEAGGAPPYWPWVQSLRGLLREGDPEALRTHVGSGAPYLAQMLPDVDELFPDLPAPPGGGPEADRFRLFDATATFLRRAGADKPIMLVLDDLHAADESSLLLLRFVARELTGAHVLIVGTFRDTELLPDSPMAMAVAELAREQATRQVSLSGLSEAQVTALIEATAGTSAVRQDLVRAIFAETEGNPLFVEEVVRLLASEGRLEKLGDDIGWRLAIPHGVREAIGRRLRRLSDECNRSLGVASVVGREFDLEVLAAVTERTVDDVLDLLDEAVEARLLTEVPVSAGRLRFAHGLIRETLYDSMRVTRRVHLHRRVGETLERLHRDDLEPHLPELAHHFFQSAGGQMSRAAEYARRAGDRASRLLAFEEAVRLYRMALRALDEQRPVDEAVRCELLLALGDALTRAGEADGAKSVFLEAANVAMQRGMPEPLAQAALGYGGRFVWEVGRGDPHLRRLLEEALSALGEDESTLRARVMARLAAGPLRDDVNRQVRDDLSLRAVEMGRRGGDPGTLAYVLDGRYAAVWWPENLEERLELSAELVEAAARAGDREREFQGHHYRCLALLESGDTPAVHREVEAKARLGEEIRQPAQRWYLVSVRAALAVFTGRFDEGERLIEEMFELGDRAQGPMARAYEIGQLYALRRLQGRLAEVEPTLESLAGEYPTYPVLRCELAQARMELGQESRAREVLDDLARDDFGVLPRNDEWLFGTCLLAEVVAALGDASRAQILYDLLLPYGARNAVSAPDAYTGSVSRNLGTLAVALSRPEVGAVHFEDALAMNERMGARPWVALTRYEYGRMLLSSDSDPARASEQLEMALETARQLGMATLEDRSSRLLEHAGGPSTRGRRMTRTFMFTDIVRSTALVEAIGDEAWQDLARWHDATLRSLFAAHGGEEIDHAGDGFFVAFAEPRDSIDCAVAIHLTLVNHRRTHGFAPRVRIGLHTAEAMKVGAGYRGSGVHLAARVGALAEGDEIVASGATAELAEGYDVSNRRLASVKGFAQPVEVVTIDWGTPS